MRWGTEVGFGMSRIQLHGAKFIGVGIALCWPGCAALGASSTQCWVCGYCCPCRAAGISGSFVTLGQRWIASLPAGQGILQFTFAKALSWDVVLQKFPSKMGLAVSAFDLPVARELPQALTPPFLPTPPSPNPCSSHHYSSRILSS